jgi:hypothetical protein
MRRFHWTEWDMAAPGEGTKQENGGIGQIPLPLSFSSEILTEGNGAGTSQKR